MATAVEDRADKRQSPLSDAVVVRFAGDSGDGMQLTGGQFTLSSALAGNVCVTSRTAERFEGSSLSMTAKTYQGRTRGGRVCARAGEKR